MAPRWAATLLLAPAFVDGHTFGTQEWNDNLGRELLGWHYELFRGFHSYGRQDWELESPQEVGHRRLQPEGDGDGDEAAPAGEEAAPAGDGDGDAAAAEGDAAADAPADAAAGGEAAAPTDAPSALDGEFKLKGNVVTLKIPCFKLRFLNITWADAIEPCGPAVEIPGEGLNFTTPFGVYFVPGVEVLDGELTQTDNAFSGYTSYLTGFFMIFYAGYNVSTPAKREAVKAKLAKLKIGHMSGDDPDPTFTPEEAEQAKLDKMDPESDKFVCPGNIYRLVCVMHPGEVGYKQWIKYCFKGLICAYMQFYLPYNILTNILKQWHFNGVKSPLYFGMNFASFFTQFAALGNVCHLFVAKCTEVIEGDAQAVNFLVSHAEPASELLKDEERAQQLDKSNEKVNAEIETVKEEARALEAKLGFASKVTPLLGYAGSIAAVGSIGDEKVMIPPWILEYNEFFWCALNIALTCFSSIILMLCMFLKVATFQGDIMNIAIVAVSLYFVFDLDDKVMQSDPKLRPRYRRMVLKQTEPVANPPRWIKSISAHTIQLLDLTIPLGLLGIILISWKGTGPRGMPIIIGGDPFKQPGH